MKEYTLTTYSFSELSEDAQEKAIDKHAQFLNEVMDSDEIAEVMNWKLAELAGYPNINDMEECPLKVYDWDISYSQGSHVGIKGGATREECPNLAWPEGSISVSLSYHNYYRQQVTLYDMEGEELDDVSEDFKDSIYSLSQDLMRAGYTEIEYQTSRESVIESIEANGYDFHENGDIARVR